VTFIAMIMLFSLLFVSPPFFLVACFIFVIRSGVFNLGMPIFYTYLHKFIPEKIRATTMSTKSMADQLVISLSYLLAGFLIDLYGPQKVIAIGGLFGIVVIALYQKIKD
jgi:predicted MFS family arabinose efflux permease